MPSLSFSHLTFSWPDGTSVLHDVTGSVDGALSALVGTNGTGKTTLLRLLAGELVPDSGTIQRPPRVAYVPQDVALDPLLRADAAMGVAPKRAALHAIESGDTDPAHFDALGDDWDVEERAVATLASLGLPDGTLDRTVDELSGGEITRLALAAALWERPDVLLLDEPTNNLDEDAVAFVMGALERRSQPTLVVSHDRRVLRRVAAVGELRRASLRWFGGTIDDYEQAIEAEREQALAELANAKTHVAKQHRELRAHVEGAGKRQRDGERRARQAGMPKIMMGAMKRKAQVTQARVTAIHEDRLGDARERLEAAQAAADRDREIRVDLPQTAVPPRRDVAHLECRIATRVAVSAQIQGPERIVLSGPNGSGKTTLLRTVLGEIAPLDGDVALSVPGGYVPQRLDILAPELTVAQNVSARAQGASPHDVREGIAKFLFRGAAGDAPAAQLSGGERLRAALAAVLLARPAPQLLVLDEPTNNLDFASRAHLLEALRGFHGALVVVSHDADFVAELEPTRQWRLDGGAFFDELHATQ